MEWIDNGGFTSAVGFRVGAARCGLKKATDDPDVALLVSDGPAAAAGAFTTNRFAAAPVRWCRHRLPRDDARGIVVNAGNANACTGRRGEQDVLRSAELAGGLLGCDPDQVLVASTGIIGHPLPMDRVETGIHGAAGALDHAPDATRAAERAIMTTDTEPKGCAVRSTLEGTRFVVGGMAKGAGMICPDMATLLCFVSTDAEVPSDVLEDVVQRVVDATLNCITVDGDTSTNDTLMVLANGASGARVHGDPETVAAFEQALYAVVSELAGRIVADGEGVTRVFQVQVRGAAGYGDARRAARAIAGSQLVKCAVHGGDPNWGRIVCALGYSGADVNPDTTTVSIGGVKVFEAGAPTGEDASDPMAQPRVDILVDLGTGDGQAAMLSSDLTEEYVRFNAAYHT